MNYVLGNMIYIVKSFLKSFKILIQYTSLIFCKKRKVTNMIKE
jgi:hypothetical protein